MMGSVGNLVSAAEGKIVQHLSICSSTPELKQPSSITFGVSNRFGVVDSIYTGMLHYFLCPIYAPAMNRRLSPFLHPCYQ
jgi:hypothetical protein